MTTLEQLLKTTNKGLINGDTLIGTVKTDGELKDNTYFFTAQGDIYYQNKEGEFHQPVFDKKKNKFVMNNKTTIEALNTKEPTYASTTQKEIQELIKTLAHIRKKEIPTEHDWFKKQLANEKPQQVKEQDLLSIIKQYQPTNASISPFGRETKNQEIIIVKEGKPQRTTTKDKEDLKKIIEYLQDKEQKNREAIEHYADKLLANTHINKNVYFVNGKKNLAQFFHEHGLNNEGAEHNSVFEHNKKEHNFWLQQEDNKIRITYEKVKEQPSFKRTTIPLENIIGKPSFFEKIKNSYQEHIALPQLHLKKRLNKAKEHFKKNLAGYVAGTVLLASTLGLLGDTSNHQTPTQEAQTTSTEQPITQQKPETTRQEQEKTYIVKKGDCLWNIAKEYATTNKEILNKTNEIATHNNKLTIAEYKKQKTTATKEQNPHLIMPGDTLYIPTKEQVNTATTKTIDTIITENTTTITKDNPVKQHDEAILTEEKEKKKEKEEFTSYNATLPTDYVSITKHLVTLKNDGNSLQNILDTYTGFTEKTIKQAFVDYQGFVQAGILTKPEIIQKYDNRVASNDFKHRITHEYAKSNKNLKTLSKELSQEYGMHISSSTISKYARQQLNVTNRKEAKFINKV